MTPGNGQKYTHVQDYISGKVNMSICESYHIWMTRKCY
jgi:hypothetical protein